MINCKSFTVTNMGVPVQLQVYPNYTTNQAESVFVDGKFVSVELESDREVGIRQSWRSRINISVHEKVAEKMRQNTDCGVVIRQGGPFKVRGIDFMHVEVGESGVDPWRENGEFVERVLIELRTDLKQGALLNNAAVSREWAQLFLTPEEAKGFYLGLGINFELMVGISLRDRPSPIRPIPYGSAGVASE
jgi:hypothetical protein